MDLVAINFFLSSVNLINSTALRSCSLVAAYYEASNSTQMKQLTCSVNLLEVSLVTYIGHLVPLVPNSISVFLSCDLLVI